MACWGCHCIRSWERYKELSLMGTASLTAFQDFGRPATTCSRAHLKHSQLLLWRVMLLTLLSCLKSLLKASFLFSLQTLPRVQILQSLHRLANLEVNSLPFTLLRSSICLMSKSKRISPSDWVLFWFPSLEAWYLDSMPRSQRADIGRAIYMDKVSSYFVMDLLDGKIFGLIRSSDQLESKSRYLLSWLKRLRWGRILKIKSKLGLSNSRL